ncbi:hypothetical protein [Haloplasma contractile]|uniref:Membrane lipoprotein n=1 Tax=Haloplasma contractile SSD-17B TaxID=1033810 RepID=U2FDZ6_9MOLU|nr:hypothetical protein [Haloplasma contractile]ERJ11200.1 membrane lipoprotein [Haloplasma contractile SSD-17B]
MNMRKYLLLLLISIPILTACMETRQYEDYVYFIDSENDYTIYLIDDFEEEVKIINPLQYLETGEDIQLFNHSPLKSTSNAFNKVDELNRLYKNKDKQLMSSSNREFVFSIIQSDSDLIKGLLICDVVDTLACRRVLLDEPVEEMTWFNKSLGLDRSFISFRNENKESLYLIDGEQFVLLYESSDYRLDVIDYDVMSSQAMLLGLKGERESSYNHYLFIDLSEYDPLIDEPNKAITTSTIAKNDFNLPYYQSFIIRGLPFNDNRMLTCNENRRTEIVSCNLINSDQEVLETYINSFNVIGFINEDKVMISESHNIYVFNYNKKTILKINDEPIEGLNSIDVNHFEGEDHEQPFSFYSKRMGQKLLLSVEDRSSQGLGERYKTYVINEDKNEVASHFNLPISASDRYYTDKVLILRRPKIYDGSYNYIIYHKTFGEFKLPDYGRELMVFDDGVYYLEDHSIKFFDVRYGEEFILTNTKAVVDFDVTKVAKNHYLLAVYTNEGTNFIRYQNNEVIELNYVLSNEQNSEDK